MTRTVADERLYELLDKKDEEIEALQKELEKVVSEHDMLVGRLERTEGGWTLVNHDMPAVTGLPVPRMEVRWFKMNENQKDWNEFRFVYSMVLRHLTGSIINIPLGMTVSRSSGRDQQPPWEPRTFDGRSPLVALPFRDGQHLHHDAALLALPAFAVFPDGTFKRIDGDPEYAAVAELGAINRRGEEDKR